jgi:hypothetical protein
MAGAVSSCGPWGPGSRCARPGHERVGCEKRTRVSRPSERPSIARRVSMALSSDFFTHRIRRRAVAGKGTDRLPLSLLGWTAPDGISVPD